MDTTDPATASRTQMDIPRVTTDQKVGGSNPSARTDVEGP